MISFSWVTAALAWLPWLGRRGAEQSVAQPMERLKRSKATVAADLQARASARLELPEVDAAKTPTAPAPLAAAATTAQKSAEKPRESLAAEAEPTSYTARLLAAKQRARGEQQRDD
jgi:hypothetical protein